MNAEKILEKHLAKMVSRDEHSYVSIDLMKEQPEWETTINAMEEYASLPKWISVEERLPTIEDADDNGEVLAIGRDGQKWIEDYNFVQSGSFINYTHWQPLPKAPEK